MSRLEEAMEKARQLREQGGGVAGRGSEVQKKSAAPIPTMSPAAPSPKPVPPAEKIAITNPLVIAAHDFDQPVAEEYRKLKSIIVQATNKDGFRNALMVTSAVSGEGKSLTALNLAISLAQEHNHTVLLVDADLRKPSICEFLGLSPQKGLSDCLMNGMDISEALIKTGLGNLTILPAGPRVANPVELFSSQKMKDLHYQIKHRYADRYVIFDTPPVLPFAEARLLGSIVDGVVFVVREGGTSQHNIMEALSSLKDSKLLGIVFNKATVTSLSDGYHYYYHDYGYKSRGSSAAAGGKVRKAGYFSRSRKKEANKENEIKG